MTKPNSGEEESGADRLSELPESLIFEIFWWLPMRDVVKTSLLSHRWKYLWTTSPYLNFNETSTNNETDARKFINSALMSSWRGTRILKLRLDFAVDHHLNNNNSSLCNDDIDSWLLFAKKHKVEELYVHLRYPQTQVALQESYRAPQCLYSCSSLRTLVLEGFSLHIPSSNVINWNKLEALEILSRVGADLINLVLLGSPNLEYLNLFHVENRENLRIQSNSLKNLLIYEHDCHVDDPCTDTELRISTPNLEMLVLMGVPYSKCLIDNAPSLTYAGILFDGHFKDSSTNKTYFSTHHLFSGTDFVGQTLRQILPAIQHVGRVGLSDWCTEALVDMRNKNMVSTFPKVEELYLHGCFEEIVGILEIFPRLKMLHIQNETAYKQFHGKKRVEKKLSISFLQELRTITITWIDDVGVDEHSIFPLIEILLKYASKLEKMIFRVRETTPPSNSNLLALLKMRRSSPTAQLIFDLVPDE